MALPNEGIVPDRFELRVRFVFGAAAGAILPLALLARVHQASSATLIIAAAGGAVAGGLLGRQYGDRFWRAFLRSLGRW